MSDELEREIWRLAGTGDLEAARAYVRCLERRGDTTPRSEDAARAQIVVSMIRGSVFPHTILSAIRDAGYCQKCLTHVGFQENNTGSLETCWNCFESQGDS